ncbi:MAG: hypothetical protein KAH95_15060, partial [Spirochaetales bacterium]|nr:hypothetical protein [Spirochaetales bacterium]
MENNSVFDRLIAGLSQAERLEMLQKMHQITPLNDLPLNNEYSEDEYDYELHYKTFSLFEKIIIFLTVLFSAKEKAVVVENLSMDKLARSLEKDNPGLINYSEKKFLNYFLLEIEQLQESLDIFKNNLPVILNSNEGDFIAFLVGLHFPEIEEKLLYSIDPGAVSADFEFENSFQLKRHIEFRIDE